MDVLSQAKRALRVIWDHGGEEEEDYAAPTPAASREERHDPVHRYDHSTDHGGSGGSHTSLLTNPHRLRSVTRASRSNEKNIYTLRPKNLDEAAIAADYLKTGSAVIINHEVVDRATSLRIIDFMSGVCYGLEDQGHAMKLGETIFLFTPGEYEINSDEVDYGENRDHFFRNEERTSAHTAPATSSTAQPSAHSTNHYASPTAHVQRVATPSAAPVTRAASGTSASNHVSGPHADQRPWVR